MNVKFKPMFSNVLVKPVEMEQKTASGIIIPDTATEKPVKGVVVAVGDGKVLENGNKVAVSVNVGDEIIYKKWSASEIKLGAENFILIDESEIMGVLK